MLLSEFENFILGSSSKNVTFLKSVSLLNTFARILRLSFSTSYPEVMYVLGNTFVFS